MAKDSKGAKHSDAKEKRSDEKQKIDAAAIVTNVVQPEIERGDLELFKTPNRMAYATVRVQRHFETYPLESSESMDLLAHATYKKMRIMPSDTFIKRVVR